ncbi:hypothetical protein [Caulifigura coniformis]|uniref:hypothetical protein n=1 Tax=Caulifigura coniformis TaxID=2527983 RepID=UPI00119DDF46|nr:hypothetical protein [Caulifigura coniformis]
MSLGLLHASAAFALDVERVEWGFDGSVVKMSLNLVTIEVANNSPTPFEGDVALQEGSGLVRSDLPLVERQLYIEPFGRRRLQFFPFITEQWSEFTLSWSDRPEDRFPISSQSNSPLRTGSRSVVLLRDASTSRQLRSKLPTFEEVDFPISAAGMDALRGVVLDHVPRWDALRMQALRDWIGAGGQIHIMKSATGSYPQFPAPLEALNEPSDHVSLGNGQVFHHNMSVADINDDFVATALGIHRVADDLNNRGYTHYDYQFQPSNSIAPLLRDLTRPDHNWGLIYFLSFIYLLVVFPGCWLLGRRRADFRISYPALLGAVFIFSLAFKTVGQRGYGEQTAWNAVGAARRVAPGRFLTETWSNAFVTNGGMYSYKHKGEGLIYSSGGSNDTRRGECFNRPDAGIEIEIPPFSSQMIMHAGVVAAPDFDLTFKRAVKDGPSLQLEAELTGAVPQIHTMHAVFGNYRVMLTRQANTLTGGSPSPLANYTSSQPNYGYSPYRNVQNDPTTIFAQAEAPLVVRSLKLSMDSPKDELSAPEGVVRVFLYADMPAEFLQVDNGPEKRQGRMLYTFDHKLEGN